MESLRVYKSLPVDLNRSSSVASCNRVDQNRNPLREKILALLRDKNNIELDDQQLAARLEGTFKDLVLSVTVYKSRYKKLKSQYSELEKKIAQKDSQDSSLYASPMPPSADAFKSHPTESDDELTVPFVPWNNNKNTKNNNVSFDNDLLIPALKSSDDLKLEDLDVNDEKNAQAAPLLSRTLESSAVQTENDDLGHQDKILELERIISTLQSDARSLRHHEIFEVFQDQAFRSNETLEARLNEAKLDICSLREALSEKDLQIETLLG